MYLFKGIYLKSRKSQLDNRTNIRYNKYIKEQMFDIKEGGKYYEPKEKYDHIRERKR